jgi:hypothetical protein
MTGMRAHGLYLVTVLAGAAVVGAAGCGNPIPDRPSYERDIVPLMEAHCIRCHGAGGTLNTDPDIPKINGVQAPLASDFTSLDGVNGHTGLRTYTGPTGSVLLETDVNNMPMPPPPSDRLTEFERDLLFTWAKNPLP